MKRNFWCIVLSLCCLSVLVGCGAGDTTQTDMPDKSPSEQTTAPDTAPETTPDTPDAGDATEDVEMARCDICGGEFEVGNIFRNHICIGIPVEPYTVEVGEDGTLIYDGVGFLSNPVDAINEAGVYTIVAESEDIDGNPWGKLKSGAGWICLAATPYRPFSVDYALESFVADYSFRAEESEYLSRMGIYANEDMSDLSISHLEWTGSAYAVKEELYTLSTIVADETLLAEVVFYGDMTAYGLSFTDDDGIARSYAITVSGKDSSLVATQYE